ncbi:unnamed protein product, partial [Protopolystoma xenopodis]
PKIQIVKPAFPGTPERVVYKQPTADQLSHVPNAGTMDSSGFAAATTPARGVWLNLSLPLISEFVPSPTLPDNLTTSSLFLTDYADSYPIDSTLPPDNKNMVSARLRRLIRIPVQTSLLHLEAHGSLCLDNLSFQPQVLEGSPTGPTSAGIFSCPRQLVWIVPNQSTSSAKLRVLNYDNDGYPVDPFLEPDNRQSTSTSTPFTFTR